MTDVTLEGVSRLYGAKAAVDDLSLRIADGEFVSLLGPSGCGKTTTLALIAGLDQPTAGEIRIGGNVMARGRDRFAVRPEARNLGLVPQSYALWPHMRVSENVGFPLKLRRAPRPERDRRVREALDLVEIGHLAERYPHELSGGQQQRVAIARTLVYRPSVLLLDEPLSNLDAKLRERARQWLRSLQRELKMTTIFVTHDQAEALSLSDRIAVLDQGRLAQFDTAEAIYNRPVTPFVADFVGGCSFLSGRIVAVGLGTVRVAIEEGRDVEAALKGGSFQVGEPVSLVVRPEWMSVAVGAQESAPNALRVKVVGMEFGGSRYVHFGEVGSQAVRFDAPTPLTGEVTLICDPARVVLFPRPPEGPNEPRSSRAAAARPAAARVGAQATFA